MIRRPFWLHRIQALWRRRSIVWLSGVRRVGKTTLAGRRVTVCGLGHLPYPPAR